MEAHSVVKGCRGYCLFVFLAFQSLEPFKGDIGVVLVAAANLEGKLIFFDCGYQDTENSLILTGK